MFDFLKRLTSFRHLRFRQQLMLVFAAGMIVLAITASYAAYVLTSKTLYSRLTDEGRQITRVFMEQSILAMIYQSADNAENAAKMIFDSPDVMGVGIYTADRHPVLEMGKINGDADLYGGEMEPEVVYMQDIGNFWHYSASVYSGDAEYTDSPFMPAAPERQLAGYVHLVMSKKSLFGLVTQVLQGNFLVSILLAALLLALLLTITKRLIKPLNDLSDLMLQAEGNSGFVRADISGPRDIADMQHAFNTMIDVLEAREEDLKKACDVALESARIKGQFASNVTHELRTPLNGIIGMLQLLEGPELTDEQRKCITAAQSSGEALLSLINEILDFSKIDAGKASPQPKPFNLSELVGDVTGLLLSQATAKNIYLRTDIDSSIPDGLSGESTRIRQVLFNLMGNAIKFTKQGGVELRAKQLESKTVRGVLELVIEFSILDTGIGISEQSQKHVFDAFAQADGTTTRNFGGTGLGLTISQQLVEFMGGQIGVESEEGRGSRFWFTVPLKVMAPVTSSVSEVSDAANDESGLPHLPENTMVLVVDDNHTNQQVAKGLLEKIGCIADVADSGEEALKVLFTKPYAAMLLDIQMPGMDGYEVTDQVRRLEANGSHIPIIAMTANNQREDAEHCLMVGMDDFLSKPFKRDELHEILAKWVIDGGGDVEVGVSAAIDKFDQAGEAEFDPEHSDSPIDRSALANLQENAGSSYIEMIEVYLEDQLLYLDAIDKGIKDGDRELLKRSAHTLKSASRHFGGFTLGNMCQAIEDLSLDSPMAAVSKMIPALRENAGAVHKILSKELTAIKQDQQQNYINTAESDATLLVVDDDRSMRVTMRAVLERDGYDIEECSNGSQALKRCEDEMPDLVLMDAMMPGIDGFTACKELRSLPGGKHVPVLVVTALDDESSIDRAFAAGANDFIPKPVNFAVLRQRISRLLDASQAEKHVRHLAYHDILTGLPNRRTFVENLQRLTEREQAEDELIAVMFLDLDRFKMVNDTLGHDAGDLLLKEVTYRIQDCVRSSDMVSRLGGDEFTIILDRMKSIEVVARIAQKICEGLAQPFQIEGQQIYITTSIGISLFPNDTTNVNALIKYADTAMFQAKEMHNTFEFYKQGMEAVVAKRMELETEMRIALEREEFTLHYQPQVDTESEEIVGMEALVRWIHPEKGMVSPADFIPLAEETGMIAPLGEWVLKQACTQLREWIDKGYPPLKLAVNISSRQFEDEMFVEKVESILQDTGVPSDSIELEITESAVMKNPESVIPVLEQLKTRGIHLAIDDFGTGHSSLNYLRRFPVDTLKIDRSFINEITEDKSDAVLVTGIIALAKSLHLRVVAEGVETKEQHQYLNDLDCDLLQGFFFFKPMPADVFEQNAFFKLTATNF